MVILWDTQYYNKIEIRKYTNNKYYDVWEYDFLIYTTYLLRDVISVRHKIVSSQEK